MQMLSLNLICEQNGVKRGHHWGQSGRIHSGAFLGNELQNNVQQKSSFFWFEDSQNGTKKYSQKIGKKFDSIWLTNGVGTLITYAPPLAGAGPLFM